MSTELSQKSRLAFFSCLTKHTRFFPVKHMFKYTYLVVGFRISLQGPTSDPFAVARSVILKSFSVQERDYLFRNDEPMHTKLDLCLREQGLHLEDFSSAYFVTAPRFLGHAFNPISFWYLYDDQGRLTTMVLEVRNTFDEKQIYILKPAIKNETDTVDSQKFVAGFEKLLFVAPFSERNGSYRIESTDPLNTGQHPTFNAQISLLGGDGKLKLHASLRSVAHAAYVDSMGFRESLRWAVGSGWLLFATEIRTIYQAVKLVWQKGIAILPIPVVLPSTQTIARPIESYEQVYESIFRLLLRRRVTESQSPLKLQYYVSAGFQAAETLQSAATGDFAHDTLVIKKAEFYGLWLTASIEHLVWQDVLIWIRRNDYLDTTVADSTLAELTAPPKWGDCRKTESWLSKAELICIRFFSSRIKKLMGDDVVCNGRSDDRKEVISMDELVLATQHRKGSAALWVMLDTYFFVATSRRLSSSVFWLTAATTVLGATGLAVYSALYSYW